MGSNPTPSAMSMPAGDEAAMRAALGEAARALDHDDVPVGAVVVRHRSGEAKAPSAQ